MLQCTNCSKSKIERPTFTNPSPSQKLGRPPPSQWTSREKTATCSPLPYCRQSSELSSWLHPVGLFRASHYQLDSMQEVQLCIYLNFSFSRVFYLMSTNDFPKYLTLRSRHLRITMHKKESCAYILTFNIVETVQWDRKRTFPMS